MAVPQTFPLGPIHENAGALEEPRTCSRSLAEDFLEEELRLNAELNQLQFPEPVSVIYNPVDYAREPHRSYVTQYCQGPKEVLFLGMNPGPFGMAQTGVPFGEVNIVRDWLRIGGPVLTPPQEHPKRPVLGLECPQSERAQPHPHRPACEAQRAAPGDLRRCPPPAGAAAESAAGGRGGAPGGAAGTPGPGRPHTGSSRGGAPASLSPEPTGQQRLGGSSQGKTQRVGAAASADRMSAQAWHSLPRRPRSALHSGWQRTVTSFPGLPAARRLVLRSVGLFSNGPGHLPFPGGLLSAAPVCSLLPQPSLATALCLMPGSSCAWRQQRWLVQTALLLRSLCVWRGV
nr:single-strand selective monofunctional uracil DNA glycosylase isoform X2 [Jaculus jaculus]XP_045009595.1 single-strand selective monofunctional uracil DNA glycosylase isoform X2 [Jaculus jaculus]